MENPRTIVGYAMDYMDPVSPELRVLGHCLLADNLRPGSRKRRKLEQSIAERLVDPLARASRCDIAVDEAASLVFAYLHKDCMVQESVAQVVADGIAEGISRWRTTTHDVIAPERGASRQHELIVFYLIDSTMTGNRMMSSSHTVRETLWALQREAAREGGPRVRVAALEFDAYRCWWLTPDGLVDVDDFAYSGTRWTTMGCNPLLALGELDAKLSRVGFLSDAGENPMVLVIVASGGYFSRFSQVEYAQTVGSLLENQLFAHATRFVIAIEPEKEGDLLTRLTRSRQAVMKSHDPQAGSLFADFIRRTRYDPWWDVSCDDDGRASVEGWLTLAETVSLALWRCGEEALLERKVLMSFVSDFMDPESIERRVLERSCSNQLLTFFVDAYAGGDDIELAARRAFCVLNYDCSIDREASRVVAWGLALGVQRALLARMEERRCEYVPEVDSRITVLKRIEGGVDGALPQRILLIRNDSTETLAVSASEKSPYLASGDDFDGADECQVVVASREIALLVVGSRECDADDGCAVNAAYLLTARKSPHASLSVGLEVSESLKNWGINPDGSRESVARGLVLTVRNTAQEDAYVECLQVFGLWYEPDSDGVRFCERWAFERIPLHTTLAPGETSEVRSERDWIGGFHVYPVGYVRRHSKDIRG